MKPTLKQQEQNLNVKNLGDNMVDKLEREINGAGSAEALLNIVRNMKAKDIASPFQGRKFVYKDHRNSDYAGEVHMRTILKRTLTLQETCRNTQTIQELAKRVKELDDAGNSAEHSYLHGRWDLGYILYYFTKVFNLFYWKSDRIKKLADTNEAISTFNTTLFNEIANAKYDSAESKNNALQLSVENALKNVQAKFYVWNENKKYRYRPFPLELIPQIKLLIPDPAFWKANAERFANALTVGESPPNMGFASYDEGKIYKAKAQQIFADMTNVPDFTNIQEDQLKEYPLSAEQLFILAYMQNNEARAEMLYQKAISYPGRELRNELFMRGDLNAKKVYQTFVVEADHKLIEKGGRDFLKALSTAIQNGFGRESLIRNDTFNDFAKLFRNEREFDTNLMLHVFNLIPFLGFWNAKSNWILASILHVRTVPCKIDLKKIKYPPMDMMNEVQLEKELNSGTYSPVQLRMWAQIFQLGVGVRADQGKAKLCSEKAAQIEAAALKELEANVKANRA